MTTASSATLAVKTGDTFAGKYQILAKLGAGGMGLVYSATHLQLGETVAIKLLNSDLLDNPEAVARFAQEARAAIRIKSEHVARVLDVGTVDNGTPYIVMEFLDGMDLGSVVASRGAVAPDQAVEFVLQACEALSEAHALGIIHRDLKPSNLFCVRGADGLPSIKVLDFGISKIRGSRANAPDVQLTRTNAITGSPLYMSPEQLVTPRDIDARTDIWSLGIVLYELVAGAAPFDGDTMTEVCTKVTTLPPPPLRGRQSEISENLERVILTCLQKERASRYANIAELALALAPFAPRRARASVERIVRVIEAAGLASTALSTSKICETQGEIVGTSSELGAPKAIRHRWRTMALVVGCLAIMGALGATSFRNVKDGASPEEPDRIHFETTEAIQALSLAVNVSPADPPRAASSVLVLPVASSGGNPISADSRALQTLGSKQVRPHVPATARTSRSNTKASSMSRQATDTSQSAPPSAADTAQSTVSKWKGRI